MNLRTKLTSLFFAALFFHAVAADDPQPINSRPPLTVAVFDFSSNIGQVFPRDVVALMTADLSTNTNFIMVERAQIKKALGEQAFGLSGEINFDAAARVGQLTGAKVLVAGRAIKMKGQMILIANIVGAETSRLYSEKVQGPGDKMLDLIDQLAQKVATTITEQSTNLVGKAATPRQKMFDDIAEKLKGKHLPTVSVEISERISGERGRHQTVQNELGLILEKAGFQILDEKSDLRPEVLITGSAVTNFGEKNGDLFSCRASLEIKAQMRKSGDIVAIDHQDSNAVDVGRQTASRAALEKAADDLAQRFLPRLAVTPQ